MNAEIPTNVPTLKGRILIGGTIHESGYARKQVFSQSAAIGTKGPTLIGETPNVDKELFLSAVDAARIAWARGQGPWPLARTEERLAAVTQFRDRMLPLRKQICQLLMWEIGKSWVDAQSEFDRTITYINDTLEEVKQLERDASRFQFAGGLLAQIRRAPLGVTLCMGPFNYPLNETFTTLIPALIMGNVLVVKVPRYGQLFWDLLLEPFRDCFPAGVVNILNGHGREIVGPAVKTGLIDVLAFIGSSPVANRIKQEHPHPNRFRSILGLDAKNPAIVLADCDLDLAVNECLRGSLSFNGQRCTALKLLFVHRSLVFEFTRRFVLKVDALKCGMPWEPDVQITPLPDTEKPAYLTSLIADAQSRGAKLANPDRGGRVDGALFYPAVLTDVPLTARLAQEEQFGPVVPIVPFDDVGTVLTYMVESKYGAQVSLFGSNPEVIGPLIDRLVNQVCRINLNTQCQRGPDVFPFTGRKDSAEGTLSVYDALRSFSIRSMVAAKQDASGKTLIRGILDGDTSRFLSTNIVL